jgi:hypothetical protein
LIRRLYYGWMTKDGTFRVSAYPPDSPVRPSVVIQTKAEVVAMIEKKRADIYWWPPLPYSADHAAPHA